MPETTRTSAAEVEHWPKIDLHRHLEGSLRLETVHELARAGEVPLPVEIEALKRSICLQPDEPRTSDHFLSKFESIRKVFQSEAIVRRAAFEAVQDAGRDGVRYLELHLTPSALSAQSGAGYDAVLERVWQGASAAATEQAIEVRLVVSLNRHESEAVARGVLAAAVGARENGVVGLDLAGDESRQLGREFVPIFEQARAAGLGLSAHAGEWAGADSVRFALEELGVERIVHGVRVLEEKSTTLMARDRRIPFMVCLTSNLQSGVVDRPQAHPLPAMIQAGLQVTLNTDDPGLSGITLSDEYRLAMGSLDLSVQTLHGMTLGGAQAAFLPEAERRALGESLQRALGLAPGR